MTFEDTFNAIKNSGKDSKFHHTHTKLYQDNHFNYIGPFFHVELIWNSKINDTLSCYLSTGQICLVYWFLHCKSKTTHVTCHWTPSTVKLEVRVHIGFATVASQRSSDFSHCHFFTCKRSNPKSNRERSFLNWSTQGCTSSSDKTRINFSISGGKEALGRREGPFAFAIPVLVERCDLIGGREERPGIFKRFGFMVVVLLADRRGFIVG